MHTYTVELRIYSETLDPVVVSENLGVQPSLVRGPTDLSGTRKLKYGLWAYDGRTSNQVPEWRSLEEGLSFLLDKLMPLKQKLSKLKHHQIIFWCGHFQSSFDGGPTLSPSLLSALAKFGVPVFIDNYFHGPSTKVIVHKQRKKK